MKSIIFIRTTYQENYGAHDWDGYGECPQRWKQKGSHVFIIEMNADLCLYTDPSKVFQLMLDANHNTCAERFTYVSHDIQFQKPTVIGTEADYIKHEKSLDI